MLKKLLAVIDMQNDFISGTLGTAEAAAIVPKVKSKIEKYRNEGWGIVFTQDTHYSDYLSTQEGKNLPIEHCIKETYGWQIEQSLSVENAMVFEKKTFGSTELAQYTAEKNYDKIELVGLCTDICVISNAMLLKAFNIDAVISVDSSCCAGVTAESHNNALICMKMCQIEIA